MNILIIGGNERATDANTICVINMAREFVSYGHKVCILVTGKTDSLSEVIVDGYKKIQIRRSWYFNYIEKLQKKTDLLSRVLTTLLPVIRHILMLPLYPNVAPFTSYRMSRVVQDIVENNSIQYVIGTYGSYESIKTAIEIKKNRKDLFVSLYYLDLCTASDNKSYFIRHYAEYMTYRALAHHSWVVDSILVPFSGRSIIDRLSRIKREIIRYVGFPVYLPLDGIHNTCTLPFDKDRIDIVYIGSLSFQNRNPEYLITILEEIYKRYGDKIKIHFWGLVTDKCVLTRIEESPIAVHHGFIDNKYTGYILSNCDYIVNFGNAISVDMLPSKIFSIFATGKPVINVVNNKLDSSLAYFNQYGKVIEIKGYQMNIENDIRALAGRLFNKNEVRNGFQNGLFKEFTPKYICETLISVTNI